MKINLGKQIKKAKKKKYGAKRCREEHKQYKKEYKQLRKRLIKEAKAFRSFDFGYMLDIMRTCVEMFYSFHSKRTVICRVSDGEWEGNYQYTVDSLKKTVEAFDNYFRNNYYRKGQREEECLKELFQLIGDNLTLWWD